MTTAITPRTTESMPEATRPEAGEILPAVRPGGPTGPREATDPYSMSRFAGASTLVLAEMERSILLAPLSPEEVTEDPPGQYQRKDESGQSMVYLSHAHARMRLNRAFGPGAWSLVPVDKPAIKRHSPKQAIVFQTWDLYVRGCYIGRATGECAYNPDNPRMTEGDAIEGAQSNALTRTVAKSLGVGLELWTRSGREALRKNRKPERASGRAPKANPNPSQEATAEIVAADGTSLQELRTAVRAEMERQGLLQIITDADGNRIARIEWTPDMLKAIGKKESAGVQVAGLNVDQLTSLLDLLTNAGAEQEVGP